MKFIFEVKVKPGFSVGQYAANWIRASEIIQRTPGALGPRVAAGQQTGVLNRVGLCISR